MSDDTPTQKFDPTGDAPTERLPVEGAAASDTPSEEVVEERKSRRLIIILASIGGALLIAVIVILIMLLTQGSGATPGSTPSPTATSSGTPSATPTASTTPSPTPTPTPTQTTDPAPPPPPPSTDAEVDSFGGTNTISCNSSAPVTPDYTLYFEWNTSNADQVFFGVGTNDAQAGAFFDNLPPDGNSQDDFPYQIEFQCPQASQIYTITVVNDNGTKDSRTITVTNTGDTQ